MAQKPPPRSEAEELEEFLARLEGEDRVREIAGWESGFFHLSRLLDGLFPGLYLLIGPPSCGKTAFAKQLSDQVAMHNSLPVIFFSFAESKEELRIRTLARLSRLESREIRKGRAFLLHWYGLPKSQITNPDEMPPGWEKLKAEAENAKVWLDLVYLFEAGEKSDLKEIEEVIRKVREIKGPARTLVIIDDSQRLGPPDSPFDRRLALVAEGLHGMAMRLKVPLVATWPALGSHASQDSPHEWAERVASANAAMVMENDIERTKKLTEPNRAITLHIVKNRGGEKGALSFDFHPAFSMFVEVAPDSIPSSAAS